MFARHDGQDKQKTLKENKTGEKAAILQQWSWDQLIQALVQKINVIANREITNNLNPASMTRNLHLINLC